MITYLTVCIAFLMISNWVNHLEIRSIRKELRLIRFELDGRD